MKISKIITDKYKLRIPPTVYYDLLADVVEAEEEQEPCGDVISRQMAINAVNIGNLHPGIVGALQSILAELPPVIAPLEEINEKLINEYISKVGCCDECFASVYCTVNGLRESRVPQDYCEKNLERYFNDKTSSIGAESEDIE